jgi:hypothetical protein
MKSRQPMLDEGIDELDIHRECLNQCRSSILWQYITRYPESLSKVDEHGYLPLHLLLLHPSSTIEDALMMMDKYPAALQHQNKYCDLPLHIECRKRSRFRILSKCIELYPEALAKTDIHRCIPLERILSNRSSTIEDALMMIEKYPAALYQRFRSYTLPIHIEFKNRCRAVIIAKSIELYPQTLDEQLIALINEKVELSNFHEFASALAVVFSQRPMMLYNYRALRSYDIRGDPCIRRRILLQLPQQALTPKHHQDYRNLNWQSRAATITLLSKMRTKHQHSGQ